MRIRGFGQGALEATFVIAIGFVTIFLLNIAIWLIEQTAGSNFGSVLKTSSLIWFNAHGVPIQYAASKLGSVQVPAYTFDLIPLGFSILIGWAIYRAGRRLSSDEFLGSSWVGAILSYGVLAVALNSVVNTKKVFVLDWQAIFIPTALFAAILIIGSVVGSPKYETSGSLRKKFSDFFINRFEKLPWAIKPLLSPALRAGTGVVLALTAFSAIFIAISFAWNWIEVIRLYQSLQLSFLGTVSVSFGQLALLPNLIALGDTWLTGVGFSIGQGSMVSPMGTELGPIPAIPMLAVLPVGSSALMILFVLIPLLAAFLATLLVKSHTAELRFNYASATSAALALGLSIGFVAAIEMFLLADFSGGSIGPGRMASVGATPWLIALVTFVEVSAAAVLAAFFSARPEAADRELIQKVRRVK
jgi:hypothetical protein